MSMRLADYVMHHLVATGVTQAFVVTGGGAMHLNDALGRTPGLQWLACHHEQACAIAAQGYARYTNRPALVQVTTGPGSTNALTGVFGAWVDSLPMIVVSGQVKRETLMATYGIPGLRQLGDQEVDTCALARPITKYAACITDPKTIRYHLERALHEATHGRPGPVWLDIPIDVQGMEIDTESLPGFDVPFGGSDSRLTGERLRDAVQELRTMLRQAERPVFYLGAGVRLAGAESSVTRLAEHFGCPIVTGFNAHDLIPSDHPLYAGRPGTIGDRSGNFCVQRADLVVVIGCRLNIRQISYNWSAFAREAQLVVVDIDDAELKKPTISPTFTMHADALDVITELLAAPADRSAAQAAWAEWCRSLRERYPVVLDEYWERTGRINPYCFGSALSELSADSEVVVTGDGTACIATFQSMQLRSQQRLFSDSGSAPMGFDVPAAIGAAVGGATRVVCIAGDGSLMMNLQELQTISGNRLPIKLFIFNNDGYLSIKLTQRGFFEGRYVGSGPASGVTFPDFGKLASAFDLPFERVSQHSDLREAIARTLAYDGPAVCEVVLDPDQPFSPRVSSKRLPDGTMATSPLEDMFPFLPDEEMRSIMQWTFDKEAAP